VPNVPERNCTGSDFRLHPSILRVNHQITNRPRFVIDDKILDVSNFAVQRLDMMAGRVMSNRFSPAA
jgi:hypothetical protein